MISSLCDQTSSGIEAVKWLDFMDNTDERGRLTAVESGITVPFPIQRVFYVHQVQEGGDRGGHAHRDTDQVLTALGGSLDLVISDARRHCRIRLKHPGKGLYLPRMTWVRMYDFSPGCVFLVFANTHYDRSRSIRTWDEYLAEQNVAFFSEPTPADLGPTTENP
ncbi:sugar 3,4-ketoisomerase [Desulfonatronum thioautotrophicum]|uniref:sugar 3,4-ketoisomerase n=1 Tax=Desulfonatronum thioautotrophicum TaxID=617001 RepID=UPI001FC9EF21|nr:FdtA/QdtA family cupin domain-containing protein [Desulfonatronum thioautotrophicum]